MIPHLRVAAVLVVLSTPALAQIYKWVDEKGTVHYGEKPPANQGQVVTRPDATGGPKKSAPQAPPNLQQQEREFQERQAKEKKQQEAEAQRHAREQRDVRDDAKARTAECRRATRDLATIRSNPSGYTFAEESRVKDSIARNCP